MCIPRPPSALPRREEGRERSVNLCRPLFVREVSSLGNRHRGEVLREAAPEFEHVDHLRRHELGSPQSEGRAAKFDVLILSVLKT